MLEFLTTRLQLVPFNNEDLDLFLSINRNDNVRRYLWDNEVILKSQAQEILETNEKQFQEERCGLWKIYLQPTTKVIGYSGLWYFFDEPQPQLIYILLSQYTGNGYATEAAQAVMDYALDELDFSYLIAAMDEGHSASEAVAQRLNMQLDRKEVVDGKPTLFYKFQN